jgi:alpha-N-arabinofuranosidase
MDWNRAVIERAADLIDYLTLHLYHGYPRFGMDGQTPKDERYKAIVSYPEWTRETIGQLRDMFNTEQRYAHLKLAVTEYNTMYSPNTVRKGLPREHTLEAAVANAANLNEFIRGSDLVEIGSFSDLVNGWLGGCIRVGDFYADQFRGKVPGWSGKSLTVYGTPTYYVMSMYANRELDYVVESSAECGTFQVNSLVPDALQLDRLPNLDVVACINESGDKLTLFVVNRSLEATLTKVRLSGFADSGEATVSELTADHYEAFNSVNHPNSVACTTHKLSFANSQLACELKASSVYVLEVTR